MTPETRRLLHASILTAAAVAALFAPLPSAAGQQPSTAAPQQTLPPGDGRDTVLQVCSQCHDPGVIATERHTRAGWHQVIVTMVSRGASASDSQFDQIENYLATAFPAANEDAPAPAR